MPIWQALGARWPAAPCPTCGTGVALALAVRATLLLFLLSPAAASADVIVLKDEGRLLSASERETWLNRARCACGAALDVVLDLSALDASGRAALVAGKSLTGQLTRLSFKYPFQLARAAISASYSRILGLFSRRLCRKIPRRLVNVGPWIAGRG